MEKLLRAGPDFTLTSIDPSSTPGWKKGRDAAKETLLAQGEQLGLLQE